MARTPSSTRILVLESDASIQQLLNAILPRFGFEPMFVPDGKAALLKLKEADIAALLVDVTLAPSTLQRGAFRGMGFLRYLERERPALLDRVIVMSALPPRNLAADLPAVARFVQKPFDIADLLTALRTCAGQRLAS